MYFPELKDCSVELECAKEFLQAVLIREDIDDPLDVKALQQLLRDLHGLPDTEPLSKCEVTVTRRHDSDSMDYWSVSLFTDRFEIKSGGYYRSGGSGGSSVSGFNFSAERGYGAYMAGADSWEAAMATTEEELCLALEMSHYEPLEWWKDDALAAAFDPGCEATISEW